MFWTFHIHGGPKRVNHAASSIGDVIYSFGGYHSGGDYKQNLFIDVHVFDTEILKWSPLTYINDDVDDVPFQRYGHTVNAYGNLIYLWGGRNDTHSSNILYCFDTIQRRWSRPFVTGCKPGPKDGHSACILNDHLLIFGGYQDDFERLSQDLHMLNLKTMIWTYVKTTGSKPCVRDFHSASVIDGSMYIFGGRSDTFQHNRVEVYDNGINYIDFQSKTWHKIDSIGTVPDGRRSHSAIVYQNKIFIFGGYNENKKLHYNDLYCFDPKKHEWTLVNTIGQKPSPRRRQCCCLVKNKLYVFGGTSPYEPTDVQRPIHPHFLDQNADLKDHSDLHILDFMPSLKTIAMLKVMKDKLSIESLPANLISEILRINDT